MLRRVLVLLPQMTICAQRDRWVAVAELPADEDEVGALGDQQADEGVAQGMERDVGDTSVVRGLVEASPVDVRPAEGAARLRAKDEVVVTTMRRG
jgi:hypothetical protein